MPLKSETQGPQALNPQVGETEEMEQIPLAEPSLLTVHLSQSLHRKLLQKSQLEGVALDDFVSELLAEGLVLRAWEIMERKSTMQKPSLSNNGSNGGRQNNNRFRNSGNNGKDGGNQNGGFRGRNGQQNGMNRRMNYNQIMDDSANFLEYVRSQEKKQK